MFTPMTLEFVRHPAKLRRAFRLTHNSNFYRVQSSRGGMGFFLLINIDGLSFRRALYVLIEPFDWNAASQMGKMIRVDKQIEKPSWQVSDGDRRAVESICS